MLSSALIACWLTLFERRLTLVMKPAYMGVRDQFPGGVKLLEGAELCGNAVYTSKLKYFLIKSQFPGGICLLCAPADAEASIGN